MSTQRKGIVFLLPQNDRLVQRDLNDFATKMNNHFNIMTVYFNELIDYSIDQLHDDGYGDYSPRLSYSFSVKCVPEIPGFIRWLNSTKESAIIRIIVTDKQTDQTDSLKVPNASHLAIMVFSTDDIGFVTSTIHPHPPIFYQKTRSIEEAILMAYAISMDSIMFNAVGLNDNSFSSEAKKELSHEKVRFICSDYFAQHFSLWFADNPNLINNLLSIRKTLNHSTPYISLLSPFIHMIQNKANPEDLALVYAKMWEHFVIWYVQEHKRYIRLNSNDTTHIAYSVKTIKDYYGQINPDVFAKTIQEVIESQHTNTGEERQIFLVIVRHLPDSIEQREKLANLFHVDVKNLYPGLWSIVTSVSIKYYVGDDNIIVHNMFIVKNEGDGNG